MLGGALANLNAHQILAGWLTITVETIAVLGSVLVIFRFVPRWLERRRRP